MLLRYPIAVAVLATAFTLAAGLFLFARPQFHQPSHGRTIDLSGYPPPDRGWTWTGGTPGFVVRTGHEEWNVSSVQPRDLPAGARLLNALRDSTGLSLLLARGRCIGVQTAGDLRWFCPPRLGPQVAFLVVDAVKAPEGYPLNLVGLVRGDVRRVVVQAPEIVRTVHPDNSVTTRYETSAVVYSGRGNWGTFPFSIGDGYRGRPPAKPWRARLDFYGTHGLLASKQVGFARPGLRLLAVLP